MKTPRNLYRVWWLFLIPMLGCLAGAIILPMAYWQTSAPLFIVQTEEQTIFSCVLLGFIFLVVSVIFGVIMFTLRNQHRQFEADLKSGEYQLPLANIFADPQHVPDVSAQPLSIMWRLNPLSGVYYFVYFGIAALGGLALFGAVPYAFLSQPNFGQPWDNGEIAAITISSALAVVALGFLIWLAVRIVPTLFGCPIGLRATEQGLEQLTWLGRRKLLEWSQMRLFEVAKPPMMGRIAVEKPSLILTLHAEKSAITWREYHNTAQPYIPVDTSALENWGREAALINLIAAKTGLEPRTNDGALERDLDAAPLRAPTPPSPAHIPATATLIADGQEQSRRRRTSQIMWAVVAVIFVVMSIAEAFLPLTTIAWANWASVAALALLALLCIWTASRAPDNQPSGPTLAIAPQPQQVTDAFALTYRWPVSTQSLVVSLLLAVNLIPAIVFAYDVITHSSPTPIENLMMVIANNALLFSLARLWGAVQPVIMTIMGLSGFTLLFFTLSLCIAPITTIRADSDGLTQFSTLFPSVARWSDIEEILWEPRGRSGTPTYLVRTNNARQAFTWPTNPKFYDATLTPTDARPITPDELAALVAARIGQDIRVVE